MATNMHGLENGIQENQQNKQSAESSKMSLFIAKWWLLFLNFACCAVGTIGGPLLLRLYYLHGGSRKWIPGWLQTVGFPIHLIPILILYSRRSPGVKFFASPKLLLCAAVIGVFTGLDNFMYSLGLSYLPVSTSSLLLATQLVFTAFFSFIIARQKFTPFSINAVVLMTLGAVMLGLRNNGDRPQGVTSSEYMLGYILTIAAAGLLGFVLPVTEVTYAKATHSITYAIVLQFQFCTALFATIFCSIGMIANKDFQAIPREATQFDLGAGKYYLLLASSAVVWQLMFLGIMGTIFCTSSLFAGIMNATLLPFTQIAGVIVYKEKFTGEKGMALALSLWGFASYFYGAYRDNKKQTQKEVEEK
ncbi:hypothetical protein AQUCO_00900686v1 [Aquilegia coerulea]|uniref:Probable purine permease n=1 Tax=Aquilegia coerulea TaxID=218851 RepID=A0A2G5EF14_AQUCA|nr:hypothetical protein AQUCO_00900686v1 [Aquilegia coerulea]